MISDGMRRLLLNPRRQSKMDHHHANTSASTSNRVVTNVANEPRMKMRIVKEGPFEEWEWMGMR